MHINKCLWALILNSVLFVAAASDLSPGHATGNVEIAEGESVDIKCHMNPLVFPGKNASDLYFSGSPVPTNEIRILDNTTIVYQLRNAKANKYYYLCNCDGNAIMESIVYVGTAPKPVKNFSCQGYDFEYMECRFERPSNNVLVTYKLMFHKKHPFYKYYPNCNFNDSPTLVICNITREQNNYSPTDDVYMFTLEANNSLGHITQNFSINNLHVMQLAMPNEGFHMDVLTHNSTKFSWRVPKYASHVSKLQFELVLEADKGAEKQLSNNPIRLRNEFQQKFDLAYAYFNYTLQIRAKLRSSKFWSMPFVYKFRSKSWRPQRPPNTTSSSFYIDPSETKVRIYWEELEFTEHNGPNFTYVISEVRKDGKIIDLKPLSSTSTLPTSSTSAVFAWQKQSEYEFEIRSSNNMGESLKSSIVHVPKMHNQLKVKMHTPNAINNVYHANNHTYTLSWLAPEITEHSERLIGYTIYWCQSTLTNECRGTIRFEDVSATTTKYTTKPTPQEQNLNLAVAANYEHFNTGMHWTVCTSDVNSDLIKMEPSARALSSTVINLQWDSERVCPSILTGYNLTYCEVNWPENFNITPPNSDNAIATMEPINCIGKYKILNILDQNAKRYNLEQLKPYTIYRIEMKMYSNLKQGKLSDPLYVRTKEDAPTPPLNLQVLNISNTSALLSWLPPATANGVIRSYEINLNNNISEVLLQTANLSDGKLPIKYKLENLMSNHLHQVFVTALTVDNSQPSNIINFSTLIGFPQMPASVTPGRNDQNETIIQWKPPAVANGRLEYYEVAVTQLKNDEVIRKRISLINGTSCVVNIPTCVDSGYRTKIDVRAVNVAKIPKEVFVEELPRTEGHTNFGKTYYEGNDELRCSGSEDKSIEKELIIKYHDSNKYRIYRSDWYSGPNYNCQEVVLSGKAFMALLVVISGVGAMIGIYIARNVYNKMSDINCMLPPGLDYYLSKNGLTVSDTTDVRQSIEQIATHNSGVTCVVNLKHDLHPFHNEKRHLLSSNDSCFLEDPPITKPQCDYEKSTPIPADYMRSISQSSSDSSTVGSNASTVVVEEPLNFSNYIKPTNMLDCTTATAKISEVEQHELNNCPAQQSNYVTIDNINICQPPATTVGYINPAEFQKSHIPMTQNFADYTTAEQLAKMNADIEDSLKETRISGYVTPGDLNVFSKQQHRHGFDENWC